MSRARITEAVLQPQPDFLRGVDGANVQVNIRGAGAATLYNDETGATTTANPATSRTGRIEPVDQPGGDIWLDTGSYDLIITAAGVSYATTFEAVNGALVANGGPPGPPGVLEIYEQPAQPATTTVGAIWIDTDAPIPSGIAPMTYAQLSGLQAP